MLRNREAAGLLLGDLLANGGTGMIIVAIRVWGALGVGAFVGATLVNQLRHLPERHVLIAIIGLRAMCPIALAFVGDLTLAMIAFGLAGRVWAPFTPVAFSFLHSGLDADEQQQVVTLWTTVSMGAVPLGLIVGGALIEGGAASRSTQVTRPIRNREAGVGERQLA